MANEPQWMKFKANGTVRTYDAKEFAKGGYEPYDPQPAAKAEKTAPAEKPEKPARPAKADKAAQD